jgi:hypothetical protein
LLNIVNEICDGEISDEIQEPSVNDLGTFIDLISNPKPLEIQENIEIENDGVNEPTFTENEETREILREKSFTASEEHGCKCRVRIHIIQTRDV